MINFPPNLVLNDLLRLIQALYNILIEKRAVSESELIGHLAKVGFTINPPPVNPRENVVSMIPKEHPVSCFCENCQKSKGMQ